MKTLAALLLLTLVHNDGRYAQSGLHDWIQGLKNKNKIGCCSTADGYPAEAENDTGDGKNWRVRIEGEWYTVPPEALIDDQPNKLGYPMVWWYPDWNGTKMTPKIRCFIPGALL